MNFGQVFFVLIGLTVLGLGIAKTVDISKDGSVSKGDRIMQSTVLMTIVLIVSFAIMAGDMSTVFHIVSRRIM